MFDAFQRSFALDSAGAFATETTNLGSDVPALDEFLSRFGGKSFGKGLYRVVHTSRLNEWRDRISFAFPEFTNRVTCFGYDWMGRAFALDRERMEKGNPGVVMFEPGTGEALEVPCDIQTFHDHELIAFCEEVLASDFHKAWLENGGVEPGYIQCIGFKKPLFLGGTGDLDNFELSDLSVYWHLMAQLIVQTKGLPPGTHVRVKF